MRLMHVLGLGHVQDYISHIRHYFENSSLCHIYTYLHSETPIRRFRLGS